MPDSADLHFAQGVAPRPPRETGPALAELAAAVKLAPRSAYLAYVHAVALNEAEQRSRRTRGAAPAVARHPADQNLLGATALIARDAGRFDEALAAARRLVELFPDQPEPRALVEEIEDRRAGRPRGRAAAGDSRVSAH